MGTKKFCNKLFIIIILLLRITVSSYSQDFRENKGVLLLFPQHELRSWDFDFINGFFSTIIKNGDFEVTISFEHLDPDFLSDPVKVREAILKLKEIDKNYNPDIIISSFPTIHGFLMKYGEEIFPDKTKLYIPTTEEQIEDINKLPDSYAVKSSSEYAIKATLEKVKLILPDLEHLIAISGVGPNENYYLDLFGDIVEEIFIDIELKRLVGVPILKLIPIISTLPDNSAVFFLPNSKDIENNSYSTRNLFPLLPDKANAPAFTFDGSSFGQGMVGGVMISAESYGKYAAETTIKFLLKHDFQPDSYNPIIVEKYDWRVLQRWGINEDILPKGSEISFKTETFIEKYKTQIILIILLIVLESFLLVVLFLNLNNRRKVEKLLKNSQELLNASQRTAKVGGWDLDLESGKMFYTNEMLNILELNPGAVLSIEKMKEFYHPEDFDRATEAMEKVIKYAVPFEQEIRLVTEIGNLIWVNINCKAFKAANGEPVRVSGTFQDITIRKNIELQLQNSLKEKDLLLKEVHHRVKNNLSIISALLELQKDTIEDNYIKELFLSSQNRIRSMALLHEQLYSEEHIESISFPEYVRELTDTIITSYINNNIDIKVSFNIPEYEMDIDTLVPLGIIINEIVSNAMKHAFIGIDNARIDICLKKGTDNTYVLSINNNGTSLPDDSVLNQKNSVGFLLIRNLVAQINGRLDIVRENGTSFLIYF